MDLCEACWPQCHNCMNNLSLGFKITRSHHDPDTEECPLSVEIAEQNYRENYRRSHHGFNEEDFKEERFKLPEITQAKNQGIREGTTLLRITHQPTGKWAEAVGSTYWEPLQAALKTLRWLIDSDISQGKIDEEYKK